MKVILLLVLTFSASFLTAQTHISGTVTDSQKRPIVTASVILKDTSGEIVGYGITSDNGKFDILIPNLKGELKVIISNIRYESKEVLIKSKERDGLIIILQDRISLLPEVKVSKRPVRLIKDTVKYDVTKFRNAKDRVLKDVIEKLPGLSVGSDGQILYQGKAINRFYIEGQNLLDDRYNIATNNLPVDAVDEVQVLENHQPIKLLDSLVLSDRSAINIKLKPNARKVWIGNGVNSLGYQPGLLHNNQLTLFKFNPKFQLISGLKVNNTGVDLTDESKELNLSFTPDNLKSFSTKQDMVNLVTIQPPNIPKQRYNFNGDVSQFNNVLIPLYKDLNLKIATSVLHTKNLDRRITNSVFYLPADTLNIKEGITNTIDKKVLFLNSVLEKNTAKTYLNNALTGRIIREAGLGNVNYGSILQQTKLPFANFTNVFTAMKNIKGKTINFHHYTAYTHQDQSLTVQPDLYGFLLGNNRWSESVSQHALFSSLYSNGFASFASDIQSLRLNTILGYTLEKQQFDTRVLRSLSTRQRDTIPSFNNQLKWNSHTVYVGTTLSYVKRRWNISLQANANYRHIAYDTVSTLPANFLLRLLPDLNFTIQNKLSNYFRTAISISGNQETGSFRDYPIHYFLQDYRSLSNAANLPVPLNTTRSVSGFLEYRNVLQSLFINMGATYSLTSSNILQNTGYYHTIVLRTATNFDNHTRNANVKMNVSKYFSASHTSVNTTVSFQKMELNMLQQQQLRTFANNSYHINSKILKDFSKRFFFSYNIDLSYITNKEKTGSTHASESGAVYGIQSLKLDLNYKNFLIGFVFDHTYNQRPANEHHFFADLNLNYKVPGRRLDFYTNAQNIFNSRYFLQNYFTGNSFIDNRYYIRPGSIMSGVRFSF